jgi:hypothetical protein
MGENRPKQHLYTAFYDDVTEVLSANGFQRAKISNLSFMIIYDDIPIIRMDLYTHPDAFNRNIIKQLAIYSDNRYQTLIIDLIEHLLVVIRLLEPIFRKYRIQEFMKDE